MFPLFTDLRLVAVRIGVIDIYTLRWERLHAVGDLMMETIL